MFALLYRDIKTINQYLINDNMLLSKYIIGKLYAVLVF